jgi:diguanylate cyclase (GGDEF)-like protein/PAS domain S-box-containing protein
VVIVATAIGLALILREHEAEEWRYVTQLIALGSTGSFLVLVVATLMLLRITRKKELGDELLRLNELRYRSIIEASPVPYALNDEQQNIVYLNGAFTRTFGYSKADLPNLPAWWPQAYPDPAYRQWVANTWQERLDRARQQNAPFDPLEVRICCKDGTERTVLAAAASFGTALEDVHLVTLYDITERKLAEEALQESELKYRTLAESAPLAIQVFSPDGVSLRVNQAWERMWGVPNAALSQYNVLQDEQLKQRGILKLLKRAFAGETVQFPIHHYDRTMVSEVVPNPGNQLWVRAFAYPVYGLGQKLLEVVVIQEDVTEQMQNESRLRLSASVFKNSGEGIAVTDAHNLIVDVNNAFTRISGYSREEVLGKDPSLLKSGHHDALFYDNMRQLLARDGYWQGEIWDRRKNGELFAERLTISTVRDEQGEISHHVAVMSDITEIKQSQERLLKAAHHDSLTGIPNRTLLADRLLQAIAQTQRSRTILAVGYLDLDGFKPVNDTYGHETGDRVLTETAARLVSCLRGGDTVARLGGDEFVFLLLGLDGIDECEAALQRMMAAIAQPIVLESVQVTLSASIGVTLYPADNVDPDTMLRHADQAMYQAKRTGKNRYFLFTPAILSR